MTFMVFSCESCEAVHFVVEHVESLERFTIA
jgi:hypothetical protein